MAVEVASSSSPRIQYDLRAFRQLIGPIFADARVLSKTYVAFCCRSLCPHRIIISIGPVVPSEAALADTAPFCEMQLSGAVRDPRQNRSGHRDSLLPRQQGRPFHSVLGAPFAQKTAK